MPAQPFSRDTYYMRRIEAGASDPFDVRVFDYGLGRIVERNEAGMLVEALGRQFSSLGTGIGRDQEGLFGAMRAKDWIAPLHYEESASVRAEHLCRDAFKNLHFREIELSGSVPAKFYCYTCRSEQQSMLRVMCSHFAVDQATHVQIRRFIRAFVAGSRNLRATSTYLDWMQTYHAFALAPSGFDERRFWENYSTATFADVRRSVTTCAPESGVSVVYSASGEARNRAETRCRTELRCRLIDFISSSLMAAIGRATGSEEVAVNWTTHGRYPLAQRTFTETSGWLSDLHPLRVRVVKQDPASAVEQFRASLTELPNWGNTFAWVSRFASDGALGETLASPFIVNVQGASAAPNSLRQGEIAEASVKRQPFTKPNARPRIYFVVSLGAHLRISAEAAGGANPEIGVEAIDHLAAILEA